MFHIAPATALALGQALLRQACIGEGMVSPGGHTFVLAGCLGMCVALQVSDAAWIRRVRVCGLTVPVCARTATHDGTMHVVLDSLN